MSETKDFIIKDRRFSAEEDQDEQAGSRKPQTTDDARQEKPARDPASSENKKEETQLPQINFATFIFSLNSSALMNLGIIEDPVSKQNQKNLPLAKQTIDILGMLEEKTRGNLSRDEEDMLKNILYDLRILYVKEKG